MRITRWHDDTGAIAFIALRYAPTLAALNLAWETAHVPWYTLRTDATPGFIAFSIVHCTLGDLMIGTLGLVAILTLTREGALAAWNRARLAAGVATITVAYTVYSEWMNTVARDGWTYAASMPTVHLGGFELGLTPVLQWLVVPHRLPSGSCSGRTERHKDGIQTRPGACGAAIAGQRRELSHGRGVW